MKTVVCAGLFAIFFAASPCALGAAPLDELGRFEGTWKSQGTFVKTPYSDPGSSSASTTCTWSGDRLFMLCQQVVSMAGQRDDDLGIYTYDETADSYRFFNIHPAHVTTTLITVYGDTITYPFSFTDKGKNVTIRTLNVWKKASFYTWRTDYTTDGGKTWTPMASGTSQRQ